MISACTVRGPGHCNQQVNGVVSAVAYLQVYFANEHPAFPEGGKMSQHFESLKIGDLVDFKGPLGHFVYTGCGSYTLNGKVSRTACSCKLQLSHSLSLSPSLPLSLSPSLPLSLSLSLSPTLACLLLASDQAYCRVAI